MATNHFCPHPAFSCLVRVGTLLLLLHATTLTVPVSAAEVPIAAAINLNTKAGNPSSPVLVNKELDPLRETQTTSKRPFGSSASTFPNSGATALSATALDPAILPDSPSFAWLLSELHVPHSLSEAANLARLLSSFTSAYYFTIMFYIVVLYVFLQAMSIPGTLFINVVCGSLFGLPVAFVLTLLCATAGASTAFFLSKLVFRRFVLYYFPERVRYFSREVDLHHDSLFNFLLFLRISPFLPNWFINLASPIIHIPYNKFALATLIGVAPQTFIAVNAGSTVTRITDPNAKLFGLRTWCTLASLALLALLPLMFRRWAASSQKSGSSGSSAMMLGMGFRAGGGVGGGGRPERVSSPSLTSIATSISRPAID